MDLLPRLILLVLLAILPIVAVQTYNAEEMRREETQKIERDAARLAEQVAVAQDRIVDGARQLLLGLAEIMGPQGRDRQGCDIMLGRLRARLPQYVELYAVAPDGATICASGGIPEPDAADRPYFRRVVRQKRFVVGEYNAEHDGNGPELLFAAPIIADGRDMAGVVVAGLSLGWLSAYLDFMAIPSHSSILVVDRAGTILVASHRARLVGQKLPDEYGIMLSAGRAGTTDVVTAGSGRRIVGYVQLAIDRGNPLTLAPADLAVGITVDPQPEFEALDASVRDHVLATAASAVLACIMALLLCRRAIGRPIERVLAAANRWIDGDYRARTGLQPDAIEFGSLGTRLDQVADRFGERETRLREVGEARRRLLAVAGHDLRQPLQSISAFIERLQRQPPTVPDPAALARVDRALSRLVRALDAVSEVARIESDALQPRRTIFPAGELLGEIEDEWGPGAGGKGLRLRVVACRHLIETDRDMMRAVLGNLVGNAVRYTERGGIVIGCRHRGDRLLLHVVDTGIGMPENRLDTVFEAFRQLAPGEGPGMGLGLWIVKRTTEELGHKLVMRSRLGQGTSFSIEIPRPAGSTGDVPAAAAQPGIARQGVAHDGT